MVDNSPIQLKEECFDKRPWMPLVDRFQRSIIDSRLLTENRSNDQMEKSNLKFESASDHSLKVLGKIRINNNLD